jgi:hypothetical protein
VHKETLQKHRTQIEFIKKTRNVKKTARKTDRENAENFRVFAAKVIEPVSQGKSLQEYPTSNVLNMFISQTLQ